MNKVSLFLNRFSNWQTLAGILLLYLLFVLIILKNAEEKLNTLSGKVIGPVDLTFGFNPQRTLQMINDYGPEGRKYYQMLELTMDLIYPMIYALLFAVILTLIYRRLLNGPVRYLNLLPFVAMFFDFLENLTIVAMIDHYPEQSLLMATLCEIFKLIKWLLFVLILFLIIYGLIKVLFLKKIPPMAS